MPRSYLTVMLFTLSLSTSLSAGDATLEERVKALELQLATAIPASSSPLDHSSEEALRTEKDDQEEDGEDRRVLQLRRQTNAG